MLLEKPSATSILSLLTYPDTSHQPHLKNHPNAQLRQKGCLFFLSTIALLCQLSSLHANVPGKQIYFQKVIFPTPPYKAVYTFLLINIFHTILFVPEVYNSK